MTHRNLFFFSVKDGVFRQYSGARTKDSLIDYVEGEKWKDDEIMPSWKHPDSVLMSVVAWFYKISMHLKNAHALLTETYELPSWSVYAIFALCTILTGAILGLVLVVCIDCVLPFVLNKTTSTESPVTVRRTLKVSGKFVYFAARND